VMLILLMLIAVVDLKKITEPKTARVLMKQIPELHGFYEICGRGGRLSSFIADFDRRAKRLGADTVFNK
jgi:hypothetical protein